MKLFEEFKRRRNETPNAPAFLITSGDRALPITWRQFTDDIAAVGWIIENNVPNSKVGLIGENSYEWMVVHAACLFSGATVVPIDVNLTEDEIVERMRFVGASAIVYSSLYADKIRHVAKRLPGLMTGGFGTRKTDCYLEAARKAIALGFKTVWEREVPGAECLVPGAECLVPGAECLVPGAECLVPSAECLVPGAECLVPGAECLVPGAECLVPGAHQAPSTKHQAPISMIVFTSGTTSEPRGAELTTEGLEEFITCAHQVLAMKEGDRSLMLLPLHHIFGIGVTYVMLTRGVALGVCPDFRRIYDAVERFRVNFLFLVPALAEILAQKIEQHGKSAEEALGSPIDWILIGGAPLPRRTYEHLTGLGVKMLTGYGLTETTAFYSIAPTEGDQHVGSAGKVPASSRTETKVSDSGELLIRGPSVMKRYYKMPDRTAKAIDVDGWYHTGDLGSIDKDGFVWITGRASRTIILSSGKKIAPEELEEKLLSLPGIREAVVSGDQATRDVRAEVYGTVPEASIRRAIDALNMTMPVYKRISVVVVRSEPFPRTSSGKIRLG